MKQRIHGNKFIILFVLIWAAQMAAAFYFCTAKQGFHEDEYYTYYSTARTNGLYVEDGRWMDRDTYRNEFVVLPDQRFQYGLVRQVQSWDVHPPVYYWIFHTAASLVPGVFSKWIGLSVNLLLHGINIVLLAYLSYLVSGKDRKLSLFAVLFFGLGCGAMSGVVFIRMYELLTTFVLLCGILHVRADTREDRRLPVAGCLLPMAAVTYLGFLTQYYYIIFLFFLGIAFCVRLLARDRSIAGCVRYGIAQAAGLALAWITYPSCLGQMFHGYRGAQATENFFRLEGTPERLSFFADLADRYAFGHLLWPFLLAAVLGIVGRRGWFRRFGSPYWMMLFAVFGYFLTVSRTALLLGDDSLRYQLPVYGIAVLLVFMTIKVLWQERLPRNGKWSVYVRYAKAALLVICLAAVWNGYRTDGVRFLYPEDRAQTANAEEMAKRGVPVVYLYQSGAEWCVWDVTDELLQYPAVWFAAAGENPKMEEAEISAAKELIVYMDKGADADAQIAGIMELCPRLESRRLLFEEKYCDVYYLYQ